MKFSRDQFEVTQYLGNQVGQKNRFMRDISCMSQKWRLIRSYLEIVGIIDKTLSKQDQEDLKMLCEIAEKIGQAEWSMDIISHLSMKVGRVYKQHDATL
jgi:hypothetical protein